MELSTKTKFHNLPEIIKFAENVFVFDITAGVPSQGGSADAAGKTADMPAQIIHLWRAEGKVRSYPTTTPKDDINWVVCEAIETAPLIVQYIFCFHLINYTNVHLFYSNQKVTLAYATFCNYIFFFFEEFR